MKDEERDGVAGRVVGVEPRPGVVLLGLDPRLGIAVLGLDPRGAGTDTGRSLPLLGGAAWLGDGTFLDGGVTLPGGLVAAGSVLELPGLGRVTVRPGIVEDPLTDDG